MLRSAVFAIVVLVVGACGTGTAPPTTPPTAALTAAPTSGTTAAPTAVVTTAPTSVATPAASPTIVPSSGPAGDVCADDWFSSPAECGGEIGDQFVFQCPPGGRSTAIYGTDTYTDDSGACEAAVHAGLITFESGGAVTVELRPGLPAYVGSTRNGVQSYDWGSWQTSFVFIGGAVAGATPVPSSPFGTPSPELAPLLAHVPPAFNVNCHKVTTLSAGEVIAASCNTPTGKGYVAYTLFDNSDNLLDTYLGNLDYFGEGAAAGADCRVGPCLVAYERDGFVEGRYFANHYTGIDPNGVIAYWMDDGLLIQADLVTYDMTFAELYDMALQAGPTP